MHSQGTLPLDDRAEQAPLHLLPHAAPVYETQLGFALCEDSLTVLRALPSSSINLVFTSPPYALHFKKAYGNADKADYIDWFKPFASEIKRVLTDDGSLVLNIGGSWNKGSPTRSIYQYKLLVELVENIGYFLAQDCFWYNPAKMPAPAEWVTVRRIRVKDSVEHIWWLSKTPWPKADNRKVLKPYSKDMVRLAKRGVKSTTRPSGWNIKQSFKAMDAGGSIAPNYIENTTPEDVFIEGNNSSNDSYTKKCKEAGLTIHPARFPAALPEFFIKMLTECGDIVLDPFAGSNTSGMVSEKLGRRWISIDNVHEYVQGSMLRFQP